MAAVEGTIRFTLPGPAPLGPIDVCMRRFGERWVAQVGGGQPQVGVALTAREALVAALSLLDEGSKRRVLADLSLLQPSIEVAQLEGASAG